MSPNKPIIIDLLGWVVMVVFRPLPVRVIVYHKLTAIVTETFVRVMLYHSWESWIVGFAGFPRSQVWTFYPIPTVIITVEELSTDLWIDNSSNL